jgi:basic membrane protein A
MASNTKLLGIAIICLVIGAAVGYAVSYVNYQPQITKLQDDLSAAQEELNATQDALSVTQAQLVDAQEELETAQEQLRIARARVYMAFGFGGLPSSYNDMGLKGLQMAQEDFGIGFNFSLPNTEEEMENALREAAASGKYELILAMGAQASGPISTVAAEYPNQKFAVLDASVNMSNVASYTANQVDIGFYSGYVMGLLTETNVTGSIWGVDYYIMRRWIAGTIEGALYANPNSTVLYSFVGSWADPVTAKNLTLKQYAAGADIVMAHSTGGDSGIIEAANETDRYVIGFGGARPQDPDHILFDVVRHAEVCIYDAIKSVVYGNFTGNIIYVYGLKEGNWDLTLEEAHPLVTDEIKTLAADIKAQIIAGNIILPDTPEEIEASIAKGTQIT